MTGVELGCGTGAGFTISGSTPGAGLITPPLASNLSLRFFLVSPCVPWGRASSGRDKSFSGIVWLPAGSPGAICAHAPLAPNPNNPVKASGNTAFINHLHCKLGAINAEDGCFVPYPWNIGPQPAQEFCNKVLEAMPKALAGWDAMTNEQLLDLKPSAATVDEPLSKIRWTFCESGRSAGRRSETHLEFPAWERFF